MEDNKIYLANILIKHGKTELWLKDEVITLPIGEYFTRRASLKRRKIKLFPKILDYKITKVLGTKINYNL